MHLINAFEFEGHFHITRTYLSGTRSLPGQIAKEIELNQALYFGEKKNDFRNYKQELKEFVNKFAFNSKNENYNIPLVERLVKTLPNEEKALVQLFFNLADNDTIKCSFVAYKNIKVNILTKKIFEF